MTVRVTFLACLCFATCVGSVAASEPGLLGYWKFDDSHDDVAVDSSGNENDGEISGAEWVRGPFGYALHFDGRGSHVSVPQISDLNGSNELTLEAWVYWEDTSRYPNIVTGGQWSPGGFLMFVQDNRCAFRMGRPGVSAVRNHSQWREVGVDLVSPFQLKRWYHLAAVFHRPTITAYVNGKPVGSRNWDETVGYAGELVIGRWSGSGGHHGLIDEIKLYNRALSADAIAADYRSTAGGREENAGAAAYEFIPREVQLATALARFQNRFVEFAVSSRGRCIALIDRQSGEDHLIRSTPLVSIQANGKTHRPSRCTRNGDTLLFEFAKAQASVAMRVVTKEDYFVLETASVTGATVDKVTLTQLALKPCSHVSTMSGLAADERFGVCLRSLNLPTEVQVGGNPPLLQAAVVKEHGLTDGRVALIAAAVEDLPAVLKNVLEHEAVAHSKLGGPFALDAERNRGSYVFANVSEKNVDAWIELARRGGIRTIHLNGWYTSLGHYVPRENLYSDGMDGLKRVVAKIHDAGLEVGIHTLTGCISPHDPWVRPVPDRRLATDGTFSLAADMDVKTTDAPTREPPGDYPTVWAYGSRGNCIRIDDELIQYSRISNESTTGFFECRRGAFGTKAASHKKDSPVHHLYVRYGCFVPDENSTLVDEVADHIAAVFNTCGMDQIYMDGAEAMRGWYGIGRMRQAIFQRLNRPALVEASCWDHRSWPFHSRVGAWDHPRWGLKRFADDHVHAVESYRRAFLLEAQLGWWVILGPSRDWDAERPDEIEYLCVKALAHDAPLSFQTVAATGKPPNARQDEYLTTIGRYERLRLANYFNDEVKTKLKAERREFQLNQADDGQWQFLPTDYLEHKVTGWESSHQWSISNRFAAEPLKLRIQALYGVEPFDHPKSRLLTDFSESDTFQPSGHASQVTGQFDVVTDPVKIGTASGRLTVKNASESAVGAWFRVVKTFEPSIDLSDQDALGVWIHGDGKGEVLNFQLTNRPEYFRTTDDHYVVIDFTGWRYVELPFRERDASAYHDYQWPYGAHTPLHRAPLVRSVVNKLTIYMNNVPPNGKATCYLSPIKALPVRKITLRHPAIEIAGRRVVLPVELESDMSVELGSIDDGRVYDERGELMQRFQLGQPLPTLTTGRNAVRFSCEGPDGYHARATVTVITTGDPIRGRNPADQIDWSRLQRQYEPPRTLFAIDGRQNHWTLHHPKELGPARLEFQLQVESVGDDKVSTASALSLDDPELAIDKSTIRFPVALHAGDRLTLHATGQCELRHSNGETKPIRCEGSMPQLGPGTHTVALTLPNTTAHPFRVRVNLCRIHATR